MNVPTILQKIAAERLADVEADRAVLSDDAMFRLALSCGGETGRFRRTLQRAGVSLIAEIKRASPSRGRIAEIPDPVELASAYVQGGARAISVLTEPRHFLGDADDLHAIAASRIAPVLRKDFLVSPRQIFEAATWGASACLLIVGLLPTRDALSEMLQWCERVRLDALVEVHDEAELDVALEAGSEIIGINARNLHDFTMDPTLFGRLRARMPSGVIAVAESGIHTREDVMRAMGDGADALLVGERLASSPDPSQAVRELLEGAA